MRSLTPFELRLSSEGSSVVIHGLLQKDVQFCSRFIRSLALMRLLYCDIALSLRLRSLDFPHLPKPYEAAPR